MAMSEFQRIVLMAASGSLIFHLGLGAAVTHLAKMRPTSMQDYKVKVEIKETPPPPPPKPPEKPKKKQRPPEPIATTKKPEKPPEKKPEPIMGLSKESFADSQSATTNSASAGNNLQMADDGRRVDPNDVGALAQKDLRSDPILNRESIRKVQYTDEARDVGLSGRFTVDVYVDQFGKVTLSELAKKVGFGMDERILAAAQILSYVPAKDEKGRPVPAWTTIVFDLRIDD